MVLEMQTSQPARLPPMSPMPFATAQTVRPSRRTGEFWILFLLAHVPLGMAMKASPWLATLHALLTVALGLAFVAKNRTPEKLILVLGYVVASESLWRTSEAVIFWESGKYILAGLSILALAKFRSVRRFDKTGIFYFLALLPSISMLPVFDRQAISFNLSGPFSLAAATIFLSAVPVPARQLTKLFLAMLGPILGLATVATFSTLTHEDIDFYSSKVASGGLGQNQASSILALGGLLAFLFLYLERRARAVRWSVGLAGIWCTAQAALTFSRGGIATTVGAVVAATFFLLQDRRSRGIMILRIAMILGLATYLVIPRINSFTEGALMTRFTSSSLTGRDKIIEADLIVFRKNPILGVGPGQSKQYHALTFRYSAAHTEYSRLLSEHGSFGLIALLLLGKISLHRLTRRIPIPAKALAAALTVWALLYMFHAAMRMSVVSFIFALGGALLFVEYPVPVKARQRPARAPAPLLPAPALRPGCAESSTMGRMRTN